MRKGNQGAVNVQTEKLDELDRRILRVLQEDADISMADLANKVGLSHTPCWRRVKRLEASGVIKKRVVLIDAKKCGFTVQVFASLSLKEHADGALESFERAVQLIPEIVECHIMSGTRDYMLRILLPDVEAYDDFLKHEVLHLPGVGSVNTSFILRSIKSTTAVPV